MDFDIKGSIAIRESIYSIEEKRGEVKGRRG